MVRIDRILPGDIIVMDQVRSWDAEVPALVIACCRSYNDCTVPVRSTCPSPKD